VFRSGSAAVRTRGQTGPTAASAHPDAQGARTVLHACPRQSEERRATVAGQVDTDAEDRLGPAASGGEVTGEHERQSAPRPLAPGQQHRRTAAAWRRARWQPDRATVRGDELHAGVPQQQARARARRRDDQRQVAVTSVAAARTQGQTHRRWAAGGRDGRPRPGRTQPCRTQPCRTRPGRTRPGRTMPGDGGRADQRCHGDRTSDLGSGHRTAHACTGNCPPEVRRR